MSKFSKSEIYPFNSQHFIENDFIETYVTDRPNPIDTEPPSVPHCEDLNDIKLPSTNSSVPEISTADSGYYPFIPHNKENPIKLPPTSFSTPKNQK